MMHGKAIWKPGGLNPQLQGPTYWHTLGYNLQPWNSILYEKRESTKVLG